MNSEFTFGFKQGMQQQKEITIELLEGIKLQIENNMEDIKGRYDGTTPPRLKPSCKIERNSARKECIDIIAKAIGKLS